MANVQIVDLPQNIAPPPSSELEIQLTGGGASQKSTLSDLWVGGAPSAAANDTLRYDGSAWVTTTSLRVDGPGNVVIGGGVVVNDAASVNFGSLSVSDTAGGAIYLGDGTAGLKADWSWVASDSSSTLTNRVGELLLSCAAGSSIRLLSPGLGTNALTVDATGNTNVVNQLLVSDGTAADPGIEWASEPGLGFYKAGGSEISAALGVSGQTWLLRNTAQAQMVLYQSGGVRGYWGWQNGDPMNVINAAGAIRMRVHDDVFNISDADTYALQIHSRSNTNKRVAIDHSGAGDVGVIQSYLSSLPDAYHTLSLNPLGGNVGVGVDAPVVELHVHQASTNSSYLHLTNSATTSAAGRGFGVGTIDTAAYLFQRENAPLIFGANNAEWMRLTPAGNFGVATTNPQARVHGRNDNASASNVVLYIQNRNALAVDALIAFSNRDVDLSDNRYAYIGALSDGTTGNDLVIAPNASGAAAVEAMRVAGADRSVTVGTAGNNRVVFNHSTASASIQIVNEDGLNSSILDFGDGVSTSVGRIRYTHTDDNMAFNTAGAEAMRIDSSGNVGIGTASPGASNKLFVQDSVATFVQFGMQAGVGGYKHLIGANDSSNLSYYQAHGGHQFLVNAATAAVEAVRIDATGQTTIFGDLRVEGNIVATGDIQAFQP